MDKKLHKQMVASQHALHASIAGLSITALTIFAGFRWVTFDCLQKSFFSSSIFFSFIQISCLIWMSDHERRVAFGDTSRWRNTIENYIRGILNFSSFVSWLSIAILLIYTVWK